jgi:hypothetical protein
MAAVEVESSYADPLADQPLGTADRRFVAASITETVQSHRFTTQARVLATRIASCDHAVQEKPLCIAGAREDNLLRDSTPPCDRTKFKPIGIAFGRPR